MSLTPDAQAVDLVDDRARSCPVRVLRQGHPTGPEGPLSLELRWPSTTNSSAHVSSGELHAARAIVDTAITAL